MNVSAFVLLSNVTKKGTIKNCWTCFLRREVDKPSKRIWLHASFPKVEKGEDGSLEKAERKVANTERLKGDVKVDFIYPCN